MSVAVMASRYSPPSPPETQSSSETISPVYPDRPIRPLPKRRLKDRLSSEAADSIAIPSAPPAQNPLFYPSPYNKPLQSERNEHNGTVPDADKALIDAQAGYPPKDTPYEFHGTDPLSDDELGAAGTTNGYRSHAIRAQSHSVASSAESADGYESFENTNNKKKRKIPTSASSGALHPSLASTLTADLANMGISGSNEPGERDDAGVVQYYGGAYPATSVSGTGISGAGRGRYGRNSKRDSRSPLSVSANASNAWQNGRLPTSRHVSGKYHSKASDMANENGIISKAIADAAATPLKPGKGQENVSLLEQQQRVAKRNTPAAQFTFNMNSEVARGPAWPGDYMQGGQYISHPGPLSSQQLPLGGKGYSQGTQTSPAMPDNRAHNPGNTIAAGSHHQQQGQQPVPPPPPPKPRRPASVRYARAARQRRADQEYQNFQHPPKLEDLWICEFCEYEAIFGRPPEALIRQYEAKDAKERKRQAEKKRLLEKAKSKGRKARKGTKASKANAAAAAAAANAQLPAANGQHESQEYAQQEGYLPGQGQPPPPMDPNQLQSDEYYSGDGGDQGYDDDPEADPPISTPAPGHVPPPGTPSGIPVPANQQHYMSYPPRKAHADGGDTGGATKHTVNQQGRVAA